MAAHSVELTQGETEFIVSLVRDGVYADFNEAIHDGLRRIEQERKEHAEKLEALRAAVQAGFDDADAGHYIEIHSEADNEALWSDIRSTVAERRQRATKADRV